MGDSWEFWIDRGGTFTDIVGLDPNGQLHARKLLSDNPERYADAAVQGIRDLMGVTGRFADNAIRSVKMGTTVATNALLERKGERVLLLITAGFRDLPRIGYQNRPRLFDLNIVRPELLHEEVAELDERLDAEGGVVRPLDEDAARAALQAAHERGVRCAAIACLHAYLNPAHEIRVAEIAAEIGYSQITASHEVSRLAKIVARGRHRRRRRLSLADPAPLCRPGGGGARPRQGLRQPAVHAVRRRPHRRPALSGPRRDPFRASGRNRRHGANRRGGGP